MGSRMVVLLLQLRQGEREKERLGEDVEKEVQVEEIRKSGNTREFRKCGL